MDYDIYRLGKIDSTNSYLLGLGDKGFPEGTVAVADEQTGGRGRFGRRWEAEPLSSLLFSVLLRPDFLGRDEIFILSFAAAVAVAEAIESTVGIEPELKWPNDVLVGGKKICGILVESDFEGDKLNHLVVGIGFNVNQSEFPEEISDRAVSLLMATGKKFDRDELLSVILARFAAIYETLKTGDLYSIMRRWKGRSHMFGKKIRLTLADKVFEGVLDDITDGGSIQVRTPSGLLTFTAGEITTSGPGWSHLEGNN